MTPDEKPPGGRPPDNQPPAGPPDEAEKSPKGTKIRHAVPAITTGRRPHAPPPAKSPISLEPEPVPVAEPTGPGAGPQKMITAIEKERKHEDEWSRTPNATGTGAIHVKTFHSKLTGDALSYMDRTINEWLDAHPQYEVKFVTSSVGTLSGKLKEPTLICQVWV